MPAKTADAVIGLINEIIQGAVDAKSVDDKYPIKYIDDAKELVQWEGDISKDLRDIIRAQKYSVALISLHSTRNKIGNLPLLSDARKETLRSIIDTVITDVIRQAIWQ